MRKFDGARTAAVLGVLSCLLLLAACEQKKINQILADPDRYLNREVGIEGKVVRSYSVLGKGAYEVDDGSGRLWVVSDRGVPRSGARVAVTGRIRDGFDLNSIVKLPDILGSGMVMVEGGHKAHMTNDK